jgi:hypothetical protein
MKSGLNSMLPTLGTELFNLVIPRNDNSEVLLELSNGSYSLPQVEIPTRRRVAQFLTKGVKEKWGLEAVCLFDPIWEGGASHEGHLNCQVLEVRDSLSIPPTRLRWVQRSLIGSKTLESAAQLRALEQSLQISDAFNSGMRPGPFAKIGWMDGLVAWMGQHLRPLRLVLTGGFQQLNASPCFSLIRFETNGVAVWFKAVGEPNLREFEITRGLAENHSQYLPRIIAVRPEWHGWLMLEAEGRSLRNNTELEQWRNVVETFSHLQVDCIGESQKLLEIGCKDMRIATFFRRIDPFVQAMTRLMQEQPAEPPHRLNQSELNQLASKLKDACRRMQLAGIPDSLFHGDFNLGNVRVNPARCVFLDWAEGCLGPPFLTLEYLIESLHSVNVGLHEYERSLRHSYANCWSAVASQAQIFEAMQFAPSLAVFSYALSSAAWERPELLRDNNIAKSLRSLTRRLSKELEGSCHPELCLG